MGRRLSRPRKSNMKRTLTLLSAISLGIIMVCSAALADGTPGTTKAHKHHAGGKVHKATKHHAAKKAAAKKTGKMTKTTKKAAK